MTDKEYQSEAFEAIHSSARALHKIRVIDKETMRNFDDACLIKNEQILWLLKMIFTVNYDSNNYNRE